MFEQRQHIKDRLIPPTIILLAWTLFGIFFGTQNYLRHAYFNSEAYLPGHVISWLVCGYTWAVLTAPVIWFARRFHLKRLNWLAFLAIHIPSGLVFALVQLALYDLVAISLLGGNRSFVDYYTFLVVNEIQTSYLVYFAIVAVVLAYDRFFRSGRQIQALVSGDALPKADLAPANGKGEQSNGQGHNGDGLPVRRISIKDNGKILLLDLNEISRVTSDGNYVNIHTSRMKYMIRETMNAMENKLGTTEFVRLRRSTIVRIAEIKELIPSFNGEYEIVLKTGARLASSRRYRKNLESILKH